MRTLHPNHADMEHRGASEPLGASAQVPLCRVGFGVRPESLWASSPPSPGLPACFPNPVSPDGFNCTASLNLDLLEGKGQVSASLGDDTAFHLCARTARSWVHRPGPCQGGQGVHRGEGSGRAPKGEGAGARCKPILGYFTLKTTCCLKGYFLW